MSTEKSLLPLWPFIVVDVLFLGFAVVLLVFGHRPLSWQESGLMILCGALGAWSFVTPFFRRSADEQALSQAKLLADATAQIRKLDQLGAEIHGATNQWLELQTHTAAAAASAKEVADTLAAEAKSLAEFMQRSSETERAHLRVEAEKLRRAEGERLQIIIQILDAVFSLLQAALRTGQPALIEQIARFHKDCCEPVRRMGLVQTVAEPGQPYDPSRHQLPGDAAPVENGQVADTLTAGYTYQGKVLRLPIVALKPATQ
jgi:molecular chaperone GrpE (heat shock protein)